MVYHDFKAKKDKDKAGKGQPLDPAKSEERSWLQSRTVALILKEFPDGNDFSGDDWSRCYKQAKKEWNGKSKEDSEEEGAG